MTHRLFSAILLALPLLAACSRVVDSTPGGAGGSAPACPSGEKTCGGACVPEDIAHGCASDSCDPCFFSQASATCSAAGECALYHCEIGWANCNGDPAMGCQTHTDADVNNCGGCGIVCSFPHAQTQCFAGKCAMLGCEAGWGSCYDTPPTNGCETYLDGDPKNCGACGNVCSGLAMCVSGVCMPGM